MTRMTMVRNPVALGALCVALLASDGRSPGVASEIGHHAGRQRNQVSALGTALTTERPLSSGGDDEYQIALHSGEYAGLIVEQRGIDVVAQVRGPNDEPISDFDDDP